MRLSPQETERFYRIWFPLLQYVNQQRRLLASFPSHPSEGSIAPADAAVLRNALWADDTLREQFIAENPEGLEPADLALVASWRYRLAGHFFVMRYLKKHTIFLTETTPRRAYGVLGLVSPFDEIIGPLLPVFIETVLLPFEGRITYDGLLTRSSISFGPGIRRSLNESYRNAQEHQGVITTLLPGGELSSSEAERTALRGRNARVLAAFRRELAKAGLIERTVEQHVQTVQTFAERYLLQQAPPCGLLDLTREDLQSYLAGIGAGANRVSFRRFARFLADTGRAEYDDWMDLSEALKSG